MKNHELIRLLQVFPDYADVSILQHDFQNVKVVLEWIGAGGESEASFLVPRHGKNYGKNCGNCKHYETSRCMLTGEQKESWYRCKKFKYDVNPINIGAYIDQDT